MGLESAPGSALGQINPASLVGQAAPVVEPRATAALAEAFRSGQIGINDIMDRVSEHTKTKQKADIVMNQRQIAEAQDPALIEARRQQMLAAGAQGQLVGAQATAALPLVQPQVEAQQAAIEKAAGEAKYPVSVIFDKYAPEVGLDTPLTSDGKVDYAKKAAIGAKLAAWATQRERDREAFKNIDARTSADGTIIHAFTKQGEPVPTAEVRRLHLAGQAPFLLDTAPGQVAAPIVAPAATSVVPPTTVVEPIVTAPSPIVVEPRADATGVPPIGARVEGGFSLGPPRATAGVAGDAVKMTGEQQQLLGRTTFTRDIATQLESAYDEMLQKATLSGGSIKGRLGSLLLTDERNPALATFKSKSSGILAPLVKGIYGETGVLSEKDIARYQPNIPSVNDSPEVGKSKIRDLNEIIHTSIINNINAMDLQKQNLDPRIGQLKQISMDELARIQAEKVAGAAPAGTPASTTAAPAAGASPVRTLSSGKKLQRNAQGAWVPVP